MRGGLACLCAVLFLLALPGFVWAEEETVRYLVELKQVDRDLERDVRQELRSHIRQVKKISERVPLGDIADQRRWRLVEVEQSKAQDIYFELLSNPAVVSVRQENVYHAASVPNDPNFAEQYSLQVTNAAAAWDKTTGSSSTVIAIIDGGVDVNHIELKNKITSNSWDFIENVSAASSSAGGSALEHGTHVAGIAAAFGNNGQGVVGVNWQAKIMSLRALSRSGFAREATVAEAINYAADNGADVINLSIAGPASDLIGDAVAYAYARGVVVVAAAGNHGLNTDHADIFPACADRGGVNMVIGVGASDDDNEAASFSNYGKCVDVTAPGKRILSTEPGNDYGKMSGTSMSSPFVAGAAGLYLAQHPSASPSQVANALKNSLVSFSGKRADRDNERLKGILNLAKLVGATISGPTPSTTPTSTPGPSSAPQPAGEPKLSVTLSVPEAEALGKILKYKIVTKNTGSATAREVNATLDADRDLVFLPDQSAAGCRQDRHDVVCSLGSVSAGEEKNVELAFSFSEDELDCEDKVRSDAEVSMLERGRDRRQVKTERLKTEVVCE